MTYVNIKTTPFDFFLHSPEKGGGDRSFRTNYIYKIKIKSSRTISAYKTDTLLLTMSLRAYTCMHISILQLDQKFFSLCLAIGITILRIHLAFFKT
jgi:hypothetical protein